MCTGVEAAIFMQALGGGLGALGAEAEGEQAEELADYNADILRYQARDAEARGEEDIRAIRRQVAAVIGSQRASLAGQGVALDVGTAADLQVETAVLGEEDVIRRRNNAMREAWGFRSRAKLVDFQGDQAKKAGSQAALGTLLGTGGDIYKTSAAG